MPVTNFPQGLSSFGFNLIGSGPYMGAGQVFWVSSLTGTDASGRGTDPTRPFKTINFALSKCFAPSGSKVGGDFIFVLPGHTELITAAGSSASPGPTGSISVNVAGVTIVGLGNGKQRPLIQWTAAAGQFIVNQPNFRIENIQFDMATQITGVTAGITASVSDVQINNCVIYGSTTTARALVCVNLTAGWANFSMYGTQITSNAGLPAAGGTSLIAAAAGDGFYLRYCYLNGDSVNSTIDFGTAIVTSVVIEFGEAINVNAGGKPILKGNNSSSGFVRELMMQTIGGGSVAAVVSGTGWVWAQTFAKNAASGTATAAIAPGANGF